MDTTKPSTISTLLDGSVLPRLLRSFRYLIPAFVCMFALVAIPIAYVLGIIHGSTDVYQYNSYHQKTRIEEFLTQHPSRFEQIEVHEASNGFAYPLGYVASTSDYDLLHSQLLKMFGDELSDRMINSVLVKADE